MTVALPLPEKLTDAIRRTNKNNRLEAQFGDGYKQIANNGLNSLIETWDLSWIWVNATDKTTIMAALESGQLLTWIPYGDTVNKTFIIVKDSLSMSFTASYFKISCQIERVF